MFCGGEYADQEFRTRGGARGGPAVLGRRPAIHDCAKGDKIVIEKSTLPVRSAAAMSRILHSGRTPHHFEVLSNPEFLAEGTAVADAFSGPTEC